jgi:hypothetical protein
MPSNQFYEEPAEQVASVAKQVQQQPIIQNEVASKPANPVNHYGAFSDDDFDDDPSDNAPNVIPTSMFD